MRSTLLAVAALLVGVADAGRSVPAIGDSLEYGNAHPDYLKKNTQIVGVMSPLSSKQRIYDRKTGVLIGPQRRRGMVFWSKKRPWNPLSRPKRAPFKVRLLRESATGAEKHNLL